MTSIRRDRHADAQIDREADMVDRVLPDPLVAFCAGLFETSASVSLRDLGIDLMEPKVNDDLRRMIDGRWKRFSEANASEYDQPYKRDPLMTWTKSDEQGMRLLAATVSEYVEAVLRSKPLHMQLAERIFGSGCRWDGTAWQWGGPGSRLPRRKSASTRRCQSSSGTRGA